MSTRSLSEILRPELARLTAYQVEDRPHRVKLDANESPYPLPAPVQAAVQEALGRVPANRYPDPAGRALKRQLAAMVGVPPEQILLGNGSDELIQMILMAVARPGAAVLVPVPTFSMYAVTGQALGLTCVEVPPGDGFTLDRDAFLRRLAEARPVVTFIASPNNPTGNCYDPDVIRAALAAAPGLVVLDEAYADFSGKTFLPELPAHLHLLILRTLSKVGLAGLRVGYLVADEAVLAELEKVRLPYNLNALSQAAATAVLKHRDLLRQQVRQIVAERERVAAALRTLRGLTVFPSEANFLLVRTARPAREVFRGLLDRGILVRDFDDARYLRDCLRITVGTPEENDALLAALRGILG
ncbi:MAG: histidinol-phosphate transaminase [candidate division NC10 bacterium]|nr:histidinol-phosphate transaminase [candidate division NC10 bacterium]